MNRGLRPLTPPRAGATPDRRAGHPREEVRQGWVNFRSPDGSVFDCRSHPGLLDSSRLEPAGATTKSKSTL